MTRNANDILHDLTAHDFFSRKTACSFSIVDFFSLPRYTFSYHDGDGIVVQCENVYARRLSENLNFLHAMSNVFDFILFYFLLFDPSHALVTGF